MRRRKIIGLFITLFSLVFLIFFLNNHKPDSNIKKMTFAKLEKIRENKKHAIIEYFNNIHNLAFGIKDDSVMLKFFNTLRKNNYTADNDYEIDKYYVTKYGDFYDILFVDSSGYVFHSIKKESDYHTNLFERKNFKNKLEKNIKTRNDAFFIDYDFYSPSDEPAAFFVISIQDDDVHIGWFVLQCSINRVNTILTERKKLGRTGEIYLVNNDKMMLNDSRFMEDSTILKLKVDTLAIKEAMRNNLGEGIIKDYRGIRVFSSFEKFNVFETSWIIIAEIDEDEIITEYYKKHKKYFQKEICHYIANLPRTKHALENIIQKKKRVDMNEFAKAESGTPIQTSGVSFCTSIVILFPDKFGYLAHITPTDEIYISNIFTKFFLRERKSDFLGEIIKKIRYYDIYPYELKKLQFVIIQPHDKSFGRAVDKILDNGLELANIKFLYNPNAYSANVLLDVDDNSVKVDWNHKHFAFMEYSSEIEDLSTILKNIIKYDIL